MTRILPRLLLVLLLPLTAFAAEPGDTLHSGKPISQGKEYLPVLPAQPTEVPPGQVEVLEFFWYGCPHCYASEESITAWREDLPDNIVFRRIPATLNRGWAVQAKAYYAAEMLGVLDRMHAALFDAFHVEGRMLANEDQLAAYFTEKADVPEDKFRKAFNSLEVASKVRRGDQLARHYRVGAVPTMIVNGRFMTDPNHAKGYARMVETADILAQRELAGDAAADEADEADEAADAE